MINLRFAPICKNPRKTGVFYYEALQNRPFFGYFFARLLPTIVRRRGSLFHEMLRA
jgi:hypothetical protein